MIQKETGWTDDYLLWGISWANVQMKLSDAPYYRYRKAGEQTISEKDLPNWLNATMKD